VGGGVGVGGVGWGVWVGALCLLHAELLCEHGEVDALVDAAVGLEDVQACVPGQG